MSISSFESCKVKEEKFDTIKFSNLEETTTSGKKSSVDSELVYDIQLRNAETLHSLEKAVLKISRASVKTSVENLEEEKSNNLLPSSLFLKFSELPINNFKEIESFIKEYGFLYSSNNIVKSSRNKTITESIGVWAILQSELQLLIKLWRALLASKNGSSCSNALAAAGLMFDEKPPFQIKNHLSSLESSKYPNFNLLSQNGHELNLGIAQGFLNDRTMHSHAALVMQTKLNKLISLANPNISFSAERFFVKGKTRRRSLMSSLGAPEPATTLIDHQSLFSAILYQMLDSIDGKKEFKKCLECFSWMEVSRKGREGNKYCDGACRNKASRRRRDIELIFAARPEAVTDWQNFFNKIGENFPKWQKKQIGEELEDVLSQISKDSLGKQSGTLRKLSQNLIL